ncbi:MinD/ParA family protein [Leifsonia sp. F6_8S_P_1B]|uniref:MinD/ParA family protein n=1 Tax=Leifsonia williamsii TaxID=3035919 RepID=A0ABT8KF46_9MICO|nr:MinD/ParA family protein [Leifsonia williamsii]MDN4615643.1 MinD/ParA family protein [Leifsonia williamsii]
MADKPEEPERGALAPTDEELTLTPSETLRIAVDLPPAPPREVPADEAAVAIDDVPVDPGFVASPTEPTTTSVAIVASRLATGPTPTTETSGTTPAQPAAADVPPPAARDGVSRRDRLRGETSPQPESAAMLTADRLLEVNRKTRPGPEGTWQRFVYNTTFHGVNLGDSAKVRARKELDHRIQKQFEGGARFVPVLTRKGGVGKTTVTTLLGMALASAREDRIVAIDANPDRGTLSERVPKQTRATVRDVVHKAASIGGFTDFSALVSRDETRLDILASDTDPLLSEAFDENDYNVVADLAARFYSIVLTDCGTGIVHSVMRATLQRADEIVIVSGGSVDEARLASETLTWLEANGYGELVSNAVVALNTATQGTNLVKLEEIESHFRSRVREIVRIPYDPQLAAGSVVSWKNLKPLTQLSARTLAALVVEGLPAERD